MDLALDEQRVDGTTAVVRGDDALDADDAGQGVDGDFGELHAAGLGPGATAGGCCVVVGLWLALPTT